MNRILLQSIHDDLVTYRDKVAAVIAAIAAFLEVPVPGAPSTTTSTSTPLTVVPPSPTVTTAGRGGRTVKKPSVASLKTRTAGATNTPASDDQAAILRALRATSPQRPVDLVDSVKLSAHRFKMAVQALERQGLVTITGATLSRRIALTTKGGQTAAAPAPAPAAAAAKPTADAPPSVTAQVEARDKAMKARLRQGPATFDQLVQAMPDEAWASDEAKRAACKASLRRLSLRNEIADVGEKFKLVAA